MRWRSTKSLLLLIAFGFCLLWRGAPVQASATGRITAVLAGNRYSLVARDDGTLWGWGDNH
ncbi:MAG TPA: RCC1 domain-containing protein, partial [Symbiobacteriaceae bacterium]|nr:RCC1 domain-containing protein [Symbiobacteriaceae bacterium]